jgi:catechol 2,3-dioxygenase-like lactoylglutathione lyase family enzyme
MSDAEPVLNQINLVVQNMEATLAFYRRLGLNIPDATVWRTASGAHHAEVQLSNGMILEFDSRELAQSYNTGWREPVDGGRGVLGFSLASRAAVDERYAALVGAGYGASQEPYDTFWGARYAVVFDPDGNPVGLMSPLDPARRRAPPEL